ncbi:hypothetical protein AB1Y20_014692 [Prymnesium parvum]|uniref:Pr1-like protein n=1 Tax=Prymnesium parvum TaxID=97485 RepID=A0AB34IDV1_PRYPA
MLRRVEKPRPREGAEPGVERGDRRPLEPRVRRHDAGEAWVDAEERGGVVALVERVDAEGDEVCAARAQAGGRGDERGVEEAHRPARRGEAEAGGSFDRREGKVERRSGRGKGEDTRREAAEEGGVGAGAEGGAGAVHPAGRVDAGVGGGARQPQQREERQRATRHGETAEAKPFGRSRSHLLMRDDMGSD